jgi:hypothetical protein
VQKAQILRTVYGAGARQIGAEHAGNQRCTEQAVRHDLLIALLGSIFLVDVRRVHIARQQSEQINIPFAEQFGNAGRLANGNFVKRVIFDKVHGYSRSA